MSAYLDTSVLIPYYLPEPRSARVESALVRLRDPVISPLVELEFASAVARRVRERALSPEGARHALADFDEDRGAGRYRLAALEAAHIEQARRWLRSLDVVLAALDALHLAVAHAGASTLITADAQLARAAKSLGQRFRLIR